MNLTTIIIYLVAAIIGYYVFRFLLKIPFYLFGIALLCSIAWFLYQYFYPALTN